MKPNETSPALTYRDSGVDIDRQDRALSMAREAVRSTFTKGVLSDMGSFGGLFDVGAMGMKDPILVASADGVGTKLQVAHRAGRHDTVGRDLVNHCVNDILVQGARPLFFLDYVGTGTLEPETISAVIAGCASACRDNGCALLGGETAEMPGFYQGGEYDLVGFIVGAVEREHVLTGERIQVGDRVLALPSAGLHTNGYSLARKVLFDRLGLGVADRFPGLDQSVADVLLKEHRSYLSPLSPWLARSELHALVHITGGGLLDNTPRVLPKGLCVRFDGTSWQVPHWFQVLVAEGGVPARDAYRTFNMGVGLLVIVAADAEEEFRSGLAEAGEAVWEIGRVEAGADPVVLQGVDGI